MKKRLPSTREKALDHGFAQLTKADVLLLKELNRLFGDVFDELDIYQSKVPSDSYLKSLLGDECFIALVARKGESIVGGLTAYVLKKAEQERSEIYVYDMAVLKDHRRRGIATGLIEELREIGKKIGAYVIFVQADKGDKPAIKLYESLGKGEEVYHFDIKVS